MPKGSSVYSCVIPINQLEAAYVAVDGAYVSGRYVLRRYRVCRATLWADVFVGLEQGHLWSFSLGF